MSRETQQDAWLKRTLRQPPPAVTEGCLDAETLAAWVDGGLSGQAAAAVELHASNCARCMAVLASMERSAPAAVRGDVWARARLLRWFVPLTAAATALAIWVAIPDGPIVPERATALRQEEVPLPPPVPEVQVPAPQAAVPAPERRAVDQNAAPSAQAPEPPARVREDVQRLEAPTAAPVQAPAAPPAAQPEAAADAAAGMATEKARLAQSFAAAAAPVESVAPNSTQYRWRVIGPTAVERSTDGGLTWARTSPVTGRPGDPALAVVGIRAVDADRAVVRTSDNREFYTANGGLAWMAVQENAKAPF